MSPDHIKHISTNIHIDPDILIGHSYEHHLSIQPSILDTELRKEVIEQHKKRITDVLLHFKDKISDVFSIIHRLERDYKLIEGAIELIMNTQKDVDLNKLHHIIEQGVAKDTSTHLKETSKKLLRKIHYQEGKIDKALRDALNEINMEELLHICIPKKQIQEQDIVQHEIQLDFEEKHACTHHSSSTEDTQHEIFDTVAFSKHQKRMIRMCNWSVERRELVKHFIDEVRAHWDKIVLTTDGLCRKHQEAVLHEEHGEYRDYMHPTHKYSPSFNNN